jgi:hypothetical protein
MPELWAVCRASRTFAAFRPLLAEALEHRLAFAVVELAVAVFVEFFRGLFHSLAHRFAPIGAVALATAVSFVFVSIGGAGHAGQQQGQH